MDLKSMTFKEIEKAFNDLVESVEIKDQVSPADVRVQVYDAIRKEVKGAKFKHFDSNYDLFEIEFKFEDDFEGMEGYGDGRVSLFFSIKAKRTDKLVEVSKTKKKYMHTKHAKPVSFKSFDINCYISVIDWATVSKDDLTLKQNGKHQSNSEAKKVTGKSVNELLEKIKESYHEAFRFHIVQPFLKQVLLGGSKSEAIKKVLPPSLNKAFEEKDNDVLFNDLADFIINEKLIS